MTNVNMVSHYENYTQQYRLMKKSNIKIPLHLGNFYLNTHLIENIFLAN